jgi:hypothetical protein
LMRGPLALSQLPEKRLVGESARGAFLHHFLRRV